MILLNIQAAEHAAVFRHQLHAGPGNDVALGLPARSYTVEHRPWPLLGVTMPIRLLSVVDLPAPLRPEQRDYFVALDAHATSNRMCESA